MRSYKATFMAAGVFTMLMVGIARGSEIDPNYHWAGRDKDKLIDDYPIDWAACKREIGGQKGLVDIIITGKKRTGELLVECMRRRGWRHVKDDEPAEAPDATERPSPPDAMPDMSPSYALDDFHKGRYQECINGLTPGIRKKPDDTASYHYHLRAKCYLKLGRKKEANVDLDNAIRVEEEFQKKVIGSADSISMVLTLGELYADRGLCAKARSMFDRVEELDAKTAPPTDEHGRGHQDSMQNTIAEGRGKCRGR